jgi:hypothetical protein
LEKVLRFEDFIKDYEICFRLNEDNFFGKIWHLKDEDKLAVNKG